MTNETVHPSVEDCRKCFKKAKKIWSTSHESDLGEGICPKISTNEVYTCEKTGKSIMSTERVVIPSCQ